ncbi:MAG: hypothetical protein WCR69_01580 [Sulfuricurvum sp.]
MSNDLVAQNHLFEAVYNQLDSKTNQLKLPIKQIQIAKKDEIDND